MWSRIETAQAHIHNDSFLELGRTRDALTIYRSRHALGSRVNTEYNPTRDKAALRHGLDLLRTPSDAGQLYRRRVVFGNVVDWSTKPDGQSPEEYIEHVTTVVATTLEDVLHSRPFDEAEMRTAETFFGNWSRYARTQSERLKTPAEKEAPVLLEKLRSARITIDVMDKRIIDEAGRNGFEKVLSEIRTIIEHDDEKELSGIDPVIKAAIYERRNISERIAKIKIELGADTTDRLREEQMKQLRYLWGDNAQPTQLTKEQIDTLMNLLMDDSKRVQEKFKEEYTSEKISGSNKRH